jgi:NAD(P)-dependent dehydrogenase (short-subunit alcohol dehydrogenase family)
MENTTMMNRNVVITGGNNGIGKATVLHLAKLGANIFFTYHSDDIAAGTLMLQLQKEHPNQTFFAHKVDLSNESEMSAFILTALNVFNHEVDCLVNNAGVLTSGNLLDMSPESMDYSYKVNVRAPLLLIQTFGQVMRYNQIKRDFANQKRKDYSIVNVVSISEKVFTGLPAYEISKGAAGTLTKVAALALAEYGIRVNQVNPGLIRTNLNSEYQKNITLWNKLKNDIPLGKTGSTDDIARAIAYLLDSNNQWTTASKVTTDGGRSLRAKL